MRLDIRTGFFPLLMAVLCIAPSAVSAQTGFVEKVLVRQRTKTLKDGSLYKGDVMLMRPHGRGKQTYADGSVYLGQFEHGHRHGKGTMTYANGDRYEGAWQKGARQGRGTYYYSDGRRF